MDEIDFDGDPEHSPRLPSLRALNPSAAFHPFHPDQKKKPWRLWTPLVNEYNRILDDPSKALHPNLQSFISKERHFHYGIHRPNVKHYLNIKVDAPDDRGIHRRVFVHLCKENFMVGSAAGILIGMSTGLFSPPAQHVAQVLAHKKVLDRSIKHLAKVAFSGTIITATFTRKLVSRAVIGGFIYDAIKRNRDEKDYLNQYLNSGKAGAICGLLFGIRGGLPHAWVAAAFTSGLAVLSEFLPWKFKDSEI